MEQVFVNDEATLKELKERKVIIQNDLEDLFKGHMKALDWNVPEANDQKAAEELVTALEEKLKQLKNDVQKGKYEFY